jgi:hypothetical protein
MMRRTIPSPAFQEFARRLVAHEAEGGTVPGAASPPEFRVAAKLGGPLTRLAGATGFRMLLERALTLAKSQEASLGLVRVEPEGSLNSHNSSVTPEGGVILIAELLGLLAAFVGEAFTFDLVLEVWPGFPVPELDTLQEMQI